MKLIPIITEKSLRDAKVGRYTFSVDRHLRKPEIKKAIDEAFGVHVVSIQTSKIGGSQKRNMRGYQQRTLAEKRARVTLKEKESIDLFEEKKSAK
ncbi:50S ribosomal protein L23 [Candidatus Woesebacteria bacterium RBG_19FT_COMBO_42_9]|uniref:Large ribosomal subunit protein uL23 n=1 Tax=Candidatus Woesebacteria bacterium RBG_16_42_24 TaxID=1802485 RepID=A0A1F7XLR1_9BACT|nr:MAG: 50S ribosomal protein L23 [Candidatus Woesebacteria bacterium RBG_16_42_24]OGM17739.1 MAG: 50S ribosomal protein L23 [Candidatus Woesebacteria bacterium RBG_19FT_COMBO_42_9]OGM66827.1 MAG: 50S ribosomal protein L23 [Candidatus Woesebacteria bacterium RIFCSPLOWO2_01_FULL_43_11]